MAEDSNETKILFPVETEMVDKSTEEGGTATAANPDEIKEALGAESEEESDVLDEYASRGLIQDIWYGQRSLAYTFWVWNIIVIIPIGVLLWITSVISVDFDLPLIEYIFFAFLIPYHIWIVVGTWRCSTLHGGFWGGLVKFMVVIGVGRNIFDILTLIGG